MSGSPISPKIKGDIGDRQIVNLKIIMLYLPLVVALFALVFAGFLIQKIQRSSPGSGKMIAIANFIKEGAVSYLKRQRPL